VREEWRALRRFVKFDIFTSFPDTVEKIKFAITNMVDSVKDADQNIQEAKEAARRERQRSEQVMNDLQVIKGNIRVFCRVKGVEEEEEGHFHFPEEDTISLIDQDSSGTQHPRRFTFDRLYLGSASQAQVFEDVKPLLDAYLDAFSCCIFAYGQTGSGKTYTMHGPASDPGVTLRAMRYVFERSEGALKRGTSMEFTLSILEIYNERIFDLLVDPRVARERRSNKTDLNLRVDIQHGVRVEGLTELGVTSLSQAIDIIELAQSNRIVGVTSANDHSSRSHLVFTLCSKVEDLRTGRIHAAKLHLVDLAGSERQEKAKTEGSAAVESRSINRSLSALQDVVKALSSKEKHIPYRNSKLTQILQDSLAGNSKVLMLVTISPLREDVKESIASLVLAKRVKTIELGGAKRGVENEQLNKIKKDHENEIAALRARIKELEGHLASALSGARRTQGENLKKMSTELRRIMEEKRQWLEDRVALEQARIEAEREAAGFKAQMILAQQQMRAGGGGGAGHISRQRGGELSRADQLFMNAIGEDGDSGFIDRSFSVMSSIQGDFVEGSRLQGWKQRVAELKLQLEQKDALEKRLRLELKDRSSEVKDLQEKLALIQRRLESRMEVYDVIHQSPADRSSSLLLPAIPRADRARRPPWSDRSHYRQSSGWDERQEDRVKSK